MAATERKQSFVARDDRGCEYVIIITPTSTPVWSGYTPPSSELELRTAGGMLTIRIAKGVYELLAYGSTICVKSDDPNAP